MELATRPVAAAGSALVAAGLIAATPALAQPLPDVPMPNIALTAAGDDLLGTVQLIETDVPAFLFGAVNWINDGVGKAGLGIMANQTLANIEQSIFIGQLDTVTFNLLHNNFVQLFDSANMLLSGGEQGALGLLGLGANTAGDASTAGFSIAHPEFITQSLLLNPGDGNPIDTGAVSGLEGALVHLLGTADLDSVAEQVQGVFVGFDTSLVGGEANFGHGLVNGEVGLEQMLLGSDSALNGIVNRGFNAVNMLLDGVQQGFNGVLGVSYPGFDPHELTAGLLTGSAAQVFNNGDVGGLLGAVNQIVALLADVAGLPGSLAGSAGLDAVDLGSAFAVVDPADMLGFLGL